MASISFKSAAADHWLPYFYDYATLGLLPGLTTTSLTFQDGNGASVTFAGTGFTQDDETAVRGTITSATFRNAAGQVIVTITGLAIPANNVLGGLFEFGNIWDAIGVLSRGADTITGSSGDDYFSAGQNAGNDKIYGLAGNDYLCGGAGNNLMDGGAGYFDTLSYWASYADHTAWRGIVLNAALGTVTNSWGGTDTIRNFECFEGSKFGDVMTGSSRNEVFRGLGGRDTIDGGLGVDEVHYNEDGSYNGNLGITLDFRLNSSGINKGYGTVTDGFGKVDRVRNVEYAWGTSQNDSFIGDSRSNLFRGGNGVDSFDGGNGSDTIDLRSLNLPIDSGATVDLTLGANQIANDGYGNTETAINMENVEGTTLADSIKLGTGAGRVWGGDGDDILKAGSSTTAQWLGGGAGADTFVFTETTLTESDMTPHLVADFSIVDHDKLDLSAFDDIIYRGTDAFSATGQSEFRVAISKGNTFLQIDEDGNGFTDYWIQFTGAVIFTPVDLILS